MADENEWGFTISCEHCKSPAQVTNEQWTGPGEDSLRPTVTISCSNPECSQPDEIGAISWWHSTTNKALVVSTPKLSFGCDDSAIMNSTHYNNGSVHAAVLGTAGGGLSKSVREKHGTAAPEDKPVSSFFHNYVDKPTPDKEGIILTDSSSDQTSSTWNPNAESGSGGNES